MSVTQLFFQGTAPTADIRSKLVRSGLKYYLNFELAYFVILFLSYWALYRNENTDK